jgi:hypothetical protein
MKTNASTSWVHKKKVKNASLKGERENISSIHRNITQKGNVAV